MYQECTTWSDPHWNPSTQILHIYICDMTRVPGVYYVERPTLKSQSIIEEHLKCQSISPGTCFIHIWYYAYTFLTWLMYQGCTTWSDPHWNPNTLSPVCKEASWQVITPPPSLPIPSLTRAHTRIRTHILSLTHTHSQGGRLQLMGWLGSVGSIKL